MAIAALFMLIGGVLQTAAQPPHLSMIYGGRVISGFGVGMVSNLAPIYVAETAPKEYRGFLGSLFEMFLVSGGLLAYWTAYGSSLHLQPTSKPWRVPLSLQIILAAVVLGGSFIIVESPRWLEKQNRWDEATTFLCYLRGASFEDEEIKTERAEIRAQIDEEVQATSGRSVKGLFQARNFFRLMWGFIKVVVTVGFLALGVQHFKRKTLFSIGAFFMAVMLFSLGAILKTHPPVSSHPTNNTLSGRAIMATIYIYIVAYFMSWGPLDWVYMGEIFPNRIRDWCIALATMIIWFFNFVISKWTPTIVVNIAWQTWIAYWIET
ncbi:putative quinate permease [Lachnellula arida]|uniref:Putative quinate permease n=1 Tax=Lachnellula arida TaxID=1316785 RepID=A0A8T9B0J5_9HELO|nr:putative quinate permease [Lachnellula arida]